MEGMSNQHQMSNSWNLRIKIYTNREALQQYSEAMKKTGRSRYYPKDLGGSYQQDLWSSLLPEDKLLPAMLEFYDKQPVKVN